MSNLTEQEIVEALQLLDIRTEADDEGNIQFNIDVTEEFEAWFKKDQGLKKWSEKRFNDWFKGLMSEKLPKVHAAMLRRKEPGSGFLEVD